MKKAVVLCVLSFTLAACSGGKTDKEYLLGLVSEAEAKVVTCKNGKTADDVGKCMSEAMQTLQTKWMDGMPRLENMSEKDAEEIAAAYSRLSGTIMQEMMGSMTKAPSSSE